MVKGVTRQVIVVQSPDPELFEQAIFIVRSRALEKGGVSEEQLLRQARQAAGQYTEGSVPDRARHWLVESVPAALMGALAVGLCWLLTAFLL